jgi:hypothetical protein
MMKRSPLNHLLHKLALLSGEVPDPGLSSSQRRHFGGLLSHGCPALVHEVGWCLTQRPHLFPEIDARARGEELLSRQERAQSWHMLERAHLAMAQACRDNYLYEEGTAIRDAVQICDRVVAGARDPLLNAQYDHRARLRTLGVALYYLWQARQAMARKPGRPEAPRKTPQQDRERRQGRRARLKELFEGILKG